MGTSSKLGILKSLLPIFHSQDVYYSVDNSMTVVTMIRRSSFTTFWPFSSSLVWALPGHSHVVNVFWIIFLSSSKLPWPGVGSWERMLCRLCCLDKNGVTAMAWSIWNSLINNLRRNGRQAQEMSICISTHDQMMGRVIFQVTSAKVGFRWRRLRSLNPDIMMILWRKS